MASRLVLYSSFLQRRFQARALGAVVGAAALLPVLLPGGCGKSANSTTPIEAVTATPAFSPAAGTYTSAQAVTLSDSTAGATIFYTTDGSTPTTSSANYTAAIALTSTGTTTIHAVAQASGYGVSSVGSATYVINIASLPPVPVAAAATPTFSVVAGTYSTAQSVTIADATAGATILYTTDGSTPTASSTPYTGAISLAANGTTTLKAIATATGFTASNVASAAYVLNIPPAYSYSNVQIVGGGFVDGIFFHPKSQGLMYARTDVGGAYRWNNVAGGDKQWVPLTDFVGRFDDGFNLGVESLALDPNDATKVYLAVGEYTESYGYNGYILRSGNMGSSFTATALPFKNGSNDNGRFAGERLSVDPNNSQHLYFGTNLNGLYESNDGAATWHAVTAFPVTGATGTSFDPGAGVVFALFLPGSGLAANGNTKTVYVGVSDPGVNALTGVLTGISSVYVSSDGGVSFQVAGLLQPTGFYLNTGTFDPGHRYLYLSYARQANVAGYQSSSSTPCTSGCNSIGPGGVNDGQIWRYTLPTAASPNGVWGGVTPPLLTGETNAQYKSNPYGFSGVTVDPNHPDTLMVTTLNKYYPPPYDDVFRSLDDGVTWVDYGLKITRDSSLSPWVNFGQSTPDGGNWLNHLVVDPFNSNHVLYGDGQTIWQTTDALAADGAAPSATAVTAGNATNWSIGALGLEETVVLGLASPPSGPAHLLSVMGDLGGFTHVSLTQSSAAQQNPQFTNGSSVDFGGQAPLIVARVGSNSSALGSGSAAQLEAYSADGGLTWTASTSLPKISSTGAAITQGQGTIAVSADGLTLLWLPQDPGAPASYSTDHGATWTASAGAPTQINQGYNRSIVAADRVNPKKFYLITFQSATTNDGTLTTYLSSDGGHTFASTGTLTNVYPTAFSVSPAAEGDVWVSANNGLFHSTDSGGSYTTLYSYNNPIYSIGFGAPAPGQSYPAIYMVGQLASDMTCAAAGSVAAGFTTATNCLYRSTDGGATFLRINDYAHQWANAGPILGDPRVFGRFYLATPGRGIVQGNSTY